MAAVGDVTPSQEELAHTLDAVCADPDAHDVIYRARNRIVVRYPRDVGGTLIVKLWARPDIRGAVRRRLGRSAPQMEWVNLRRFRAAGIRVPTPHGFLHANPNPSGFTEALFLEDLGNTVPAMHHVNQLHQNGLEEALERFQDELITMTADCLEAGLIDTDHGLVNMVVPTDGHAVRLDLELARRLRLPYLFPARCGEMIGNLLGTYAFAVQPDTHHVTRFAERLLERIDTPQRVLQLAAGRVQYMMDYQSRRAGIVTEVQLPW